MSETGELPCIYCGTEPPPMDDYGRVCCCRAGLDVSEMAATVDNMAKALNFYADPRHHEGENRGHHHRPGNRDTISRRHGGGIAELHNQQPHAEQKHPVYSLNVYLPRTTRRGLNDFHTRQQAELYCLLS